MFAFIKKKNLRAQSIFWLSFTFICSFLILLGVDYKYHRDYLHSEQWSRLESATDLIATSFAFEYMARSIDTLNDPVVKDLFILLDAIETKTSLDGYFVFYEDSADLNLIKSSGNVVPMIKEQSIPMDVRKACNTAFYTGSAERVEAAGMHYFVRPIIWNNTNKKFGVCVYSSAAKIDANLQWFMHATSITTVIVLLINSLLLFYVINTVIFKPFKDIMNTVNLFVHQTFAEYFSFFKNDANEIDSLRAAVKRLEALFNILRAQMAESERYRKWICNISKDSTEKMDVFSGTAEFMALCDNDFLVGNGYAWNKKQAELTNMNSSGKLLSLYLCYIHFINPFTDRKKFMDEALRTLGIMDIPLDSVFRLSEDSFLFVFYLESDVITLTDWLRHSSDCKFGTAQFVAGDCFSIRDMLIECMKNASF